ncbi:hypothetical protein [uncultured Treponema sp.]|uniref:hypothetical protein n=1 Tax=uncultured Treponema sp. TaxID=162155 RepID=UPI0025F672D7|nr:hypothetical protein [uncultured Treponema sp.]
MEVVQYETHLKDVEYSETLVLSENEIKIASFWSHLLCTATTNQKFEPLFVMENIIPCFDRTFNYLIEPEDFWKHGKDVAAFYNAAQNMIVIRSDVYEGAQNGSYIDVITIAHEVVHCIQSIILRFIRIFECAEFKKELSKIKVEQIQEHEFQTDLIMRLLFSPEEITKGRTQEEVLDEYVLKPVLSLLCILIKKVGKQFLDLIKEENSKIPAATQSYLEAV